MIFRASYYRVAKYLECARNQIFSTLRGLCFNMLSKYVSPNRKFIIWWIIFRCDFI